MASKIVFKSVRGNNFAIHSNEERGIEIFGYKGKRQKNGKWAIFSPKGEKISLYSIPKIKKFGAGFILSPPQAIILFFKGLLSVEHFEKSPDYEEFILLGEVITEKGRANFIITKNGTLQERKITPKIQ